ncbi:hypothetical protein OCU04_009179 [Sclerotinia nivalis]|uniref:Cytochrome P450 n=1 Tax=Sclerotinia nivalis TaxID=352851 RepID=A0A9X0DIA0_9HELO|nr:hypothetical protein OCU04_009179 [Sclerotinia nivalis]
MLSPGISQINVVAILGTSILVYCILGVVYRLYFHPLSRFPGPKLPAATQWSEFYYECIQSGRYFVKIAQWHEQYGMSIAQLMLQSVINSHADCFAQGPIIRIGPNELHIDDPEYYNTLFSYSGVRNKDPFYTAQFNTPDTGFGSVDHYVHRMRRSALNPFFSKASINRLSPMLIAMVPDFSPSWAETFVALAVAAKWCKFFPKVYTLMEYTPRWVLKRYAPGVILTLDHHDKIRAQIKEILSGSILPVDVTIDGFPRTIFHNFLSSSLPESEKTFGNMSQEAINVIGAGTDTVANTLMILVYYLAGDRARCEKLREELKGAGLGRGEGGKGGNKRVELEMVERLVYLIPVGMSTMLQHHNEKIFPSSHQFIPERWVLPDGTINYALERYLTAFSRGTRICIGQLLAKVEIHLALAVIISRFNIQLYDTEFDRDVKIKQDYFLPQPGSDSRGVRVLLS